MTQRHAARAGEPLADFLADWEIHLRALNRSRGTIESYTTVAAAFCAWLAAEGLPDDHTAITRATVGRYLAALHERVSPATVAKHYRSLQQLFRWLVNDGELERSPMETMSPPAVPDQPVPVLDMESWLGCSSRVPATPLRTAATPPSSDCSSTPACVPVS